MAGPGGASRALRSVPNRSAIHHGRAGRPGETLELPLGREAAPQVIALVAMGADRFDLEAVLLDPLGQSGDRQAVLPSVRAHAEAGDCGASSRWTRSCIGQILPPPRRPGSAGLRRPRWPRPSRTRLLRSRAQSRGIARATGSGGCRSSGRRSGKLMRLAGCGLTAPPRNYRVAPTRSACAAVGTCRGTGSEPVGLSSPDLLRRHSRPAAARAGRGRRCLRSCGLALQRSSPAGL